MSNETIPWSPTISMTTMHLSGRAGLGTCEVGRELWLAGDRWGMLLTGMEDELPYVSFEANSRQLVLKPLFAENVPAEFKGLARIDRTGDVVAVVGYDHGQAIVQPVFWLDLLVLADLRVAHIEGKGKQVPVVIGYLNDAPASYVVGCAFEPITMIWEVKS